jgi:hypothetical protein
MAVATGVTLSGSLTGIVRDIYTRAYKYKVDEGVCKALVTPVGVGQKGPKVVVPLWNPTTRTGTAATEGERFTAFTSYLSTTREYVETEWAEGTILTYDDFEDASESVRDEHGRMHGIVHGKKIEKKIAATFASFTKAITATSASGLTVAKFAAAIALQGGDSNTFGDPAAVLTPNVWYRLQQALTNNTNYGVLGDLGNSVLNKYYQGTVMSVPVYLTKTGITAATSVTCAMFSKEAIGLFMPRDFTLKTQEEVDLRGYKLVSTHRAGARVHIVSAGVKITTLGSNPS